MSTTYTSATAAPFPQSFMPIPYATGESLVSRVWSTVKGFVELQVTEDRVVADEEACIPRWVVPVFLRMRELESLPANWDSYGGIPVQRRHRDAALRFLGLVLTDEIARPDIVPLADGGLQLEWRHEGMDVDFISDDEVMLPTLMVTRGDESLELTGVAAVHYFLEAVQPTLRDTETARAWR